MGVQELIDRLKSEGVEEGQQQAEALLAEAKKQAVVIVDAAHAEADKLVKEAQRHVGANGGQWKTGTRVGQPRHEPPIEGATPARIPRLGRSTGPGPTAGPEFRGRVDP